MWYELIIQANWKFDMEKHEEKEGGCSFANANIVAAVKPL